MRLVLDTTPRIAPDPDDDVVIGTAQVAKADWIVSGDSHLLNLKAYQDILIVTAATAVERINKAIPRGI